jgi:hypothetical protein
MPTKKPAFNGNWKKNLQSLRRNTENSDLQGLRLGKNLNFEKLGTEKLGKGPALAGPYEPSRRPALAAEVSCTAAFSHSSQWNTIQEVGSS